MTQNNMAQKDLSVEVLVVGGGLVGLTLGVALAGAGMDVAVVDREEPSDQKATPFDGRSSAIALGSQRVFDQVGLWDGMTWAAEAIRYIEITDGQIDRGASPLSMSYDFSEVGDMPMGWIVENRAIRLSTHAKAAELENLHHLAPHSLRELERDKRGVVASLDDGTHIKARLVIGADGRGSQLRKNAGIKVSGTDYHQNGIVCTVVHEKPHNGVAFEHFLPSGPFALLPLPDSEEGVHRSSLVWSEKRDLVDGYMAMSNEDFANELHRRFGESLGAFTVTDMRWSYPLSSLHAERYTDTRLALVGDAAHGMHPIAGQGLNLGLRDVAALAQVVVDSRRVGLDVGSPQVLEDYAKWRRFDNVLLLGAMDGLVKLFSNDLAPVRVARDLGLATVDKIPPVKRFFMKHAMGIVGDLPRLMQGEKL
ncbi:UbiH/UbiF/VisC/COQ6 family ubiquinone biosynthesis hydroxylase [Kiloniella sp. EL199]|uniref:UbiH/UbiF/VisC/COQ6 family ubiquinone biosynthesis hydroxylase n=1 Tax=Kiloniella sp. EL199 TaxID=2107581 RepID=UPI0020B12370|nr:UbiH/UbiF/VisC/COQ6 family ubiquinone biosynthesis hydroxylase [Kiloniella sp. EL199]